MPESIKLQWLLGDSHRQSKIFEKPNQYFEELSSLIDARQWGSLKELLEQPEYEGVINFTNSDGQGLIHLATLGNDPNCITVLLDKGARPNLRDPKGRSSLHLAVVGGCRCVRCSADRVKCIEILASRGSNLDPQDAYAETPLYYAARNMLPECAEKLLDLGCNLHHWNENTTATTLLVEYVPNVMKKEFDKCIFYDKEDSSKLQINFRLLTQDKAVKDGYRRRNRKDILFSSTIPRETELLQQIIKARSGKEALVTHPVVETFLYFKWLEVQKFFFFLRSTYFLLVLLYTFTIFQIYSYKCFESQSFFTTDDSRFYDLWSTYVCQMELATIISAGVLYAAAFVIICSEIYKACKDSFMYSVTGTNFLWWILSGLWIVTLIPVFGLPPEYWQYPIAAVGMIYSWIMTLLQLERIPWFAIYVGILVKVLTDFLKMLLTYSTVIVAFTLGFCVLLPNHDSFNIESFLKALFKAFIMMKGDLDYEGLFDKVLNPYLQDPAYSILAHLLFVSFVITVTLLLTSLLVGQAVADIGEIKQKAVVDRSIRLIVEIGLFETIIRSRFLACGLSAYLCKRYAIQNYLPIRNYRLTFSAIDPYDDTLPNDIKQKLVPYMSSCPCQVRKSYLKSDT